MALEFKPITLEDKERISAFTLPSDYQNCDFAFANMCSWRFLYDSEYAIDAGFLQIRFWIEEHSRLAYMMPVGQGELRQAIEAIEADSLSHGHPLCMLGISPDAKALLEESFPGAFIYIPERDYFDYIYLRTDLANLEGRKYQPKRNHINKFKDLYQYTYREITPELIPECLELESRWLYANNSPSEEVELSDERRAILYAMNHFGALGLLGGALCVEGNIVAFTFGSPINHNTFGVHIEKGDTTYEGVYQVINQEFAAHIPEQYRYVNREEDLGIPGLRQSKLTYHPTILLEKNAVVKRNEKRHE